MFKTLSFLCLLVISHSSCSQNYDSENLANSLGTYESTDGNEYVIGKSSVRLFLFDPQTLDYRGLYQENDSLWVSYPSLLKDSQTLIERKITFNFDGRKPPTIKVFENNKSHNAIKTSEYSEQNIIFKSNGIDLKGTLLMPNTHTKVPAVVMVHGSGEQDRNGYASYIRIIADHLAKNGIAVLTYDKRGSGESEGDWRSASFGDLAQDALKGREFLSRYEKIDQNQIGIGGSSQAGWILAKATERNSQIPFIFCISGAGMGISAAKQNIYNNVTELKILGADDQTLSKAKDAWYSLYRYVETSENKYAQDLDENVNSIKDTVFYNYFPPTSTMFSLKKKENWFQTLEVTYNPSEDWKKYNGHIYAAFGELDASTPVKEVLDNLIPTLETGINKSHQIIVYPGTSHLILEATLKSDSEFSKLKKFYPYFLPDLSNWILQKTGYQSNSISKVLEVEKEWLRAYEDLDSNTMDNILDADFLITFPNGFVQNKTTILSNLKKDTEECPKMRIYTTRTFATEYDDVIILRGIVNTQCGSGSDISFNRQRYTDTYLLKDGRWQVVASHLSEHK